MILLHLAQLLVAMVVLAIHQKFAAGNGLYLCMSTRCYFEAMDRVVPVKAGLLSCFQSPHRREQSPASG